ncbi:hypothetical protein M5D96_010786 [Drosophila gunungcola]|uniref:Uncharacterized protein n=1 Tax=Drosophila gunungcola TaxID=103775 RepID=A0A9P9YGU7_9MUSC|nr:hypothetical protein M5D96_010786 [Drosophila gunungcola]
MKFPPAGSRYVPRPKVNRSTRRRTAVFLEPRAPRIRRRRRVSHCWRPSHSCSSCVRMRRRPARSGPSQTRSRGPLPSGSSWSCRARGMAPGACYCGRCCWRKPRSLMREHCSTAAEAVAARRRRAPRNPTHCSSLPGSPTAHFLCLLPQDFLRHSPRCGGGVERWAEVVGSCGTGIEREA